jgi:peptidoglycan hydrolase-like protein with peptidoglycan-binding domain
LLTKADGKGESMPVLKKGSSGPDVTALQQKLKDLGFDPKGVDGNFGGVLKPR